MSCCRLTCFHNQSGQKEIPPPYLSVFQYPGVVVNSLFNTFFKKGGYAV